MGIRYLNKFLQENASSSIKLYNLSQLSGKKIAVDISIYLYRFNSDNSLIENMYLMLALFRNYNIIPVFIFDGKPPCEKMNLLKQRKEKKFIAEQQYNDLKVLLQQTDNIDNIEKQEIISNMDKLKKEFIYIKKNDITNVKNLIRAYGCSYYDAPGEADELCAYLTIKNKVWGCLSEDMDMIVYGCPRVLRYFSLLNHNVVIYDVKNILKDLEIEQHEFREICVLSGTDYNYNINEQNTLYNTLKLFKKYNKIKNNTNQKIGFYDWLNNKYNDYIKDYDLLIKINHMFDLTNYTPIHNFNKIKIQNSNILQDELRNILKEDGFVFPE